MKTSKDYSATVYRMRHLLGVLVALVVLDGLISNFLIRGGLAREGNPFLRNLVGDGYFIAIKALAALLCALILVDIHKHWPGLALVSTWCFLALYVGIVSWNLFVFFISLV